MAETLLWPHIRWPDNYDAEKLTAGPDVNCVFVDEPTNVTDEQWASVN